MKTYKEEEVSKLIHDVKNPLTSIISFSEMLLEDDSLSQEERSELLQIIYEEAKKISDILNAFKEKKEVVKKKEEIKTNEEETGFVPSQGKAKILVVDDDGSIRRVIRMDLEKAGYIVYTAYNGIEGLEMVKEVEPDLIISDIEMPKMDGVEFYEKLRAEDTSIPFIFLTGSSDEERKISVLKLGVDGYLTKPFSKKELIVRVESLLEKAKKINQNIYVDALPKVYNRKFLNEKLPAKIEKAIDTFTPLSVAMCDIDHFKKINDVYGHQAGDMVLSFLGNFLKTHVRGNDIVARYGGEEFLILLEGIGKKDAYNVMERLREALSKEEIDIDNGRKIKITISIGISSFPDDGSTLKELIEASDIALYKAKNEGRNRVILAENTKKEDTNG